MTVHIKPVICKDDDKTTLLRSIWHRIEATRIYSKCYAFCSKLRRSWAYARFGWDNYDFDGAYALRALSFKLKRLQRLLLDGHVIQDEASLKSLRLAIRLLDRLVEDDYNYFLHCHNLKWYDTEYPPHGFEKVNDGRGCSRMVFPSESLPENKQAQEHEEHVAAWAADEKLKNRDKRWVFSIIEKYYEHWWD